MLTLSVSECDLILLEAGGDLQQAEADLVIWRPCGEGAGLLRVCLPDISLRDRAWRMWCRESSHGSTTDSRLVLKWKQKCQAREYLHKFTSEMLLVGRRVWPASLGTCLLKVTPPSVSGGGEMGHGGTGPASSTQWTSWSSSPSP